MIKYVRGNKILGLYLSEVDTIPEICDRVYAVGKAIASSLGVHTMVSEQSGKRKAKVEEGNRRARKLKEDITELRQMVSRTSNEFYKKKQRRKTTAKEKIILQQLRNKCKKDAMDGGDWKTTQTKGKNVTEFQVPFENLKKYVKKRK